MDQTSILWPYLLGNHFQPVLVSISMLTFVRNRATNALPLVLGLFFKIEGTSSRVMKMLSNAGLCVSSRTVERVKESISEDCISRATSLMNSGKLFYTVVTR